MRLGLNCWRICDLSHIVLYDESRSWLRSERKVVNDSTHVNLDYVYIVYACWRTSVHGDRDVQNSVSSVCPRLNAYVVWDISQYN